MKRPAEPDDFDIDDKEWAELAGLPRIYGTQRTNWEGTAMNGNINTPVGIPEIAERLGVERGTVDQWRYRELLPDPQWTVGGRPAWDWPDILKWAKDTGRA